jgi:membrane dipeptidase
MGNGTEPTAVIGHWDVYELIHRVRNAEDQPFQKTILPDLRTGGVKGVFFAAGGDSKSHAGGSDHFLRGSLESLDLALSCIEASGDAVTVLRTVADVEALRPDQIGFVLVFEGGRPLEGSLSMLRQLYRLGVRCLLLTWNGRNELGDGVGEGPESSGLSHFGKAVVREMRRLGMMLDLSHLNARGFWDAVATYEGPVTATHSNAKALHDHPRNLTDEQIKAIGETGGLVGVAFLPTFLGPGQPTVDTIVDHIAHIGSLIGIDKVGIGPDFSYGPVAEEHRRTRKYEGIQVNLQVAYPIPDATQLPRLPEALRARGFREAEIRGIMGDNLLRVFKAVLPGSPRP